MKKILFFLLISSHLLCAQDRDPRDDQFNFAPGQLIVKLKDNVDADITYKKNGIGSTQSDIGALLGIGDKVSKTTVLFSEQTVLKSAAMKKALVKDPRLPEPHSLKNTFVLELNDESENILGLVEKLKNHPDVEYAEPDYHYSVNDFTIESDIISSRDATSLDIMEAKGAPDDPLYSQQSNISKVKIDQVWNKYTTGDGSQIIGILDTGIDYDHPDLSDNIWINEAELNGVAGFDDDGNGYIDDIRGWDFINQDNAPLDDNMHGTHVAGIAGAVGGNGIGIAGAAWNVKLMPIKVFQSNGVGNASTIALGVEYATNNGATILNMSFGSYAESMTLRNALENAYASSVLVAAAGNDGVAIGPCILCFPFYPAAYTYVIGVESPPKPRAGFTNYDQDGPIFSGYDDFLNYEVGAPGTGILSTVPNGGYRALTGTSMASPLVAGGIALYLQQKPEDSKELLFGNLINTSSTYLDILAAIEVVPTPELQVLSAMTKDTINGQNGNGYLEPNETIEIFPLVKNYWGPTDDVRVGIEFAEFEDTTKATILTDEIAIGSISAYATLQYLSKSLKIKIAEGVANNVIIKFNLKVWSGDNYDYLSSTEYIITVKNSILLYGIKSEDMTLYADKEYLVTNNLIFMGNSILTIKPGSTLTFSNQASLNMQENSHMIANGTKDSIIIFTAETDKWAGMKFPSPVRSEISFAHIEYVSMDGGASGDMFQHDADNTSLEDVVITDCYFYNFDQNYPNSASSGTGQPGASFNRINIDENFFYHGIFDFSNEDSWFPERFDDLNITNTKTLGSSNNRGLLQFSITLDNTPDMRINALNAWSGEGPAYILSSYGNNIIKHVEAYIGTTDTDKINQLTLDAFNNSLTSSVIDRSYISQTPYEGAHGLVWKVLVNDKDAQDEYELMDPIGVGTHQFDVYFNRAMDTTYTPQVSYGVREPYNQKIITESGTWSTDSMIYSVSHEVKIGAADGINRIRVQDARDPDLFEIPIEDSRFNMLVQSAGSASAGFAATPGLGEITLDWEAPDSSLLADVLGYNMYRFETITDSTFTDTIKLNNSLIYDPLFKDYQVEEGKIYYYQYKILRTSFDETDFSKTVATSPLTSKLGDANGDFEVNVMDLVTTVDYILGNNPTPFIFKAADVNADTYINVLDIVGTVDIILNPTKKKIANSTQAIEFYSNVPIGEATFYWEGDDLYVESKEAIGGLQLAFKNDFSYVLSESVNNFEWLNYSQDNQKILMMYSFNGLSISPGKTKLLTKVSTVDAALDITKAVVGTPKGFKLTAIYKEAGELLDIEAPTQSDQAEFITVYPNPSSGIFNIQYYIPELMDKVLIQVYNLKGERIWSGDEFKNTSGQASASINLSHIDDGIYLVVMDALRSGEIKKREVKKLIISKN